MRLRNLIFIALVPSRPEPSLHHLADAAVERLDEFRAPPSVADLDRRRNGLSSVQEDNLIRWGYPYVFTEFRFHMTLSQRICEPEITAVETIARVHFREHLAKPVPIDTLGLFVEREPGGSFDVVAVAALKA
jgi:hypothetical protein